MLCLFHGASAFEDVERRGVESVGPCVGDGQALEEEYGGKTRVRAFDRRFPRLVG